VSSVSDSTPKSSPDLAGEAQVALEVGRLAAQMGPHVPAERMPGPPPREDQERDRDGEDRADPGRGKLGREACGGRGPVAAEELHAESADEVGEPDRDSARAGRCARGSRRGAGGARRRDRRSTPRRASADAGAGSRFRAGTPPTTERTRPTAIQSGPHVRNRACLERCGQRGELHGSTLRRRSAPDNGEAPAKSGP
jgi:hypothetical protein